MIYYYINARKPNFYKLAMHFKAVYCEYFFQEN